MAGPGESRQSNHGWAGWYDFLLGPPFKLIGFFYRTFTSNRDRLARFLARPKVKSTFGVVMLLTMALWLAVWLLASEEYRERLTDAVRDGISSIKQ